MVKKETLAVLEQALNRSILPYQIDFFIEDKDLTFEEYNSAISSEGKHKTTDKVPAGLCLYGEENFIGTPDTVFNIPECGPMAFYQLVENE